MKDYFDMMWEKAGKAILWIAITVAAIIVITMVTSCTSQAQIPPQYAYMDNTCTGKMPNVVDKLSIFDDCSGIESIIQMPVIGSDLSEPVTPCYVQATDGQGNEQIARFDTYLLDTIPPQIFYNDTIAFTNDQAGAIYHTWEAWIKADIDRLNGFEAFRQLQVDGDSVQVWYNSIAIYPSASLSVNE